MEYEIATLTVNPAIDLSTSVDRLEPFHKLRSMETRRDAGGGGINISRTLKRFGLMAPAIYPAGGCKGDLLQQLVQREGLESYSVAVEGETREDFTVVNRTSGEQFRFVLPGPALKLEEVQNILGAIRKVAPHTQYLIASGSLPEGAPADFFAQIGAIVASCGSRFVLDTSGVALASALSQPVFLLKPNLREFESLIGKPLRTVSERVTAARQLIRTHKIGIIALTLGEEGAIVVTEEKAWFGAAPKVQAISTVGTGDSFLAGLMWRLVLGGELDDALRYGIAAGSAAMLAPGTELCRLDDVTRLLPQVAIREICDAQ